MPSDQVESLERAAPRADTPGPWPTRLERGDVAKSTCSIEGCERICKARGWCKMHYERWTRHGDPLRERPTLAERFWAKVDVRGEDECWPWFGHIDLGGYGRVRDGDHRLDGVHRVAYALVNGPIPLGMTIDHTCHNADLSCVGGRSCLHRRCCNPAHLEAVAHSLNVARGRLGEVQAARTHCPQGHPYAGANLYIHPSSGQRCCRACARAATQRWRERQVGLAPEAA